MISRAWLKIQNSKQWSFLVADAAVVCPALINAGTFNIIQFTNVVTADSAASAVLTPFIAGVPLLAQLQIRFMGLGQTSQIYNIVAVDPTNPNALVLTLDRMVYEPTNTGSQYLVYRAYIIPPEPNFVRWLSLVDMVNGFTIAKDKLTYTSAYFDLRDPQRQALGLAYFCGYYRVNDGGGGGCPCGCGQSTPCNACVPNTPQVTTTGGQPIYELWPHSTQGQTFYVRYRRRGAPFANQDDCQAPGISDELIVQLALLESGYPHVQANLGQFPSYKGVNWAMLYQTARNTIYGVQGRRGLLMDAKLNDDETGSQNIIARSHGLKSFPGPVGFPYPIDSNFFQSHPVFW